jgi:hypothetical protein
MATDEERLSSEMLSALCGDLKSLSGKYGKSERRVDGTLISNDEGYVNIFPNLQEHLAETTGGIGIFVGSGGLLSLIPDTPINVAVVVDKNPAVFELTQVIAELIMESNTPGDVLQKLRDPNLNQKYPILREVDDSDGALDLIGKFIKKESREYGNFHWTHPERFNHVKDALRKKPVVYVAADITEEGFGTDLSETARAYGESITFANFTNVHSYIKPATMDFLNNWPFNNSAGIIYSSHKDTLVGDLPKMHLAKSLGEYIQETEVDIG